ncbi:unnamed protein product [Symbiodinium necroappetens]|uniref:ABM domain-containing protein n=1 Tax=Symbiodinium necroappetens TaxID=1628268 RepID=A0A812N4L2_9DINO|nr:unnamed protein product [Symbiodinium necroappetens]
MASSLCTIHAYFQVLDEAVAGRILQDFVEHTKDESGCLWYAWDRSGDKLFCNEAYEDAQAVLTHMENLGKAGTFKDAAKLTQIEFHGPAVELEKLRSAAEAVNGRLFTEDGGAGFMHPLTPSANVEPASLCTLHAYYDLTDEGKAEPVLGDLATRTKSERGCVYHGWTKAGNTLFCREGYLDSDAVLAHLNNVASCTGLADCTRLRCLELHGPPSQLAKLQGIAQQMGAECYERQEGFQRVALASAVNARPTLLAVARRSGGVEPWRQLFRALTALKYVGLAGLSLTLLTRLARRTQRRNGWNVAVASLMLLLGHLAERKLPSGEMS